MENNKWHYLGRWIEPVLSTRPWLEWNIVSKELGLGFKADVTVLDAYQYVLKEDVDRAIKFVEDKIENDIKWFDYFFNFCDERINDVLSFDKNKDLEGMFKATVRALGLITILMMFDIGFQKYIEKASKKEGINPGEFLASIKPYKKTLLTQYLQELKKLDKNNEQGINSFLEKYGWVGKHVFLGDGLTREKLEKEIAEINEPAYAKGFGEAKQETKELETDKTPKNLKEVWELGCKFAFYRSFIVENINSVIFKYCPMIKELGEKHRLSWDDILLFDYKEVIDLSNKQILPDNFKDRKNGFGIIVEDAKVSIITGVKLKKGLDKFLEKVDKDIKEFKGMVASKGKITTGVVKVVEESKYISKMNKGDILVANETTPDYVVGMKIAGAIITNQGGITSHAAITSREMKIPCIIGTKIATKVLKDGDLVEVDTDKGTVRLIKQ